MKRQILKFASAVVLTLSALVGCNSQTTDNAVPRELTGVLQYTGATYMPFHSPAPYNFELRDINDGFVAYVDTTKLIMPQINTYMGKLVSVRGTVMKRDGENVINAEFIKKIH